MLVAICAVCRARGCFLLSLFADVGAGPKPKMRRAAEVPSLRVKSAAPSVSTNGKEEEGAEREKGAARPRVISWSVSI